MFNILSVCVCVVCMSCMQIEALASKHMKAAVSDPQMRAALTPNYSLGCKRILASDSYCSALAQANVQLVPSGLKQVGVRD